ncbi:uroporphyrinogen-III synthase [Arenimonas terrae]|uniref:Uroporphyrinogen-III synthase n=1 Tax=Arenimonas terrae TaxID=2546226 RepID=A0A5C4RQC6_9GAMM|nr:uroporphyrinogen-III synthase [Arenimonas terrae]TNJ33174.1 uroporphyrinogen-III synthase [Arenimonas terrae]
MAKPRSTPLLAGWYVISLRPSGGHAPVRRAAAALGARVLPLSTLRLAALDAGVALAAALACDDVVFTSPAAVRFAARQAPLRPRPGQRWLAVGAGTAAALRRSGVPAPLAPSGRADSEALLALPALEQVAGRDIGLVTAPGGRGVIAETLAHRGARVHLASVYQREAAPPRSDRLRAAVDAPAACALLVSSAEAFDVLWAPLPAADRERLRARPVVASSPRLAVMLAGQGFQSIVTAASAIPSRMLAALAADVAQGRFR